MGGPLRAQARLAVVIALASLAWGCESVGPSALVVGDCLDRPVVVGDFGELHPVACDQPHGAEVFYVGELPAESAYPDPDAVSTFVTDACLPAYEAYTGVDLMTQDDMDIGWLPPSEEDWAAGSRRIVCYATPYQEGDQTTGSIRRP
jgi:Septum formation